jgi:hypothetical protein
MSQFLRRNLTAAAWLAPLLVLVLLLVPLLAQAEPKAEVLASMHKFAAARSYHVEMAHSQPKPMTTSTDFVAPDRYRMQMPIGTQVVIGEVMYLTMQGRTMTVPLPKGTLGQWRDPAQLAANEATLVVQALGTESVDGKPARKYLTRNASAGVESTLWIGGDGYPLQIRVDGQAQGRAYSSLIRYSRYNDPTLRIEAPK